MANFFMNFEKRVDTTDVKVAWECDILSHSSTPHAHHGGAKPRQLNQANASLQPFPVRYARKKGGEFIR